MDSRRYTGSAKKSVQVFPFDVMDKLEKTFLANPILNATGANIIKIIITSISTNNTDNQQEWLTLFGLQVVLTKMDFKERA